MEAETVPSRSEVRHKSGSARAGAAPGVMVPTVSGLPSAQCQRPRSYSPPASLLRSLIVDPTIGSAKYDRSDEHRDQDQYPGQSRRVTHVKVLKAGLEQVQHVEECRAQRPALSDDVHPGEHLKGINQAG